MVSREDKARLAAKKEKVSKYIDKRKKEKAEQNNISLGELKEGELNIRYI